MDVISLIDLAGAALEAEDRYVLGASSVRGEKGGLLRVGNERYYQFIICRAWLSRWHTTAELNYHDAVISADGAAVATVEMKRWWSPTGEPEIPGISSDIERLQRAVAPSSFLVIFSANPVGQTAENIRFLIAKLPVLNEKPTHLFSFPTLSPHSDGLCEFWVAGWQIK